MAQKEEVISEQEIGGVGLSHGDYSVKQKKTRNGRMYEEKLRCYFLNGVGIGGCRLCGD